MTTECTTSAHFLMLRQVLDHLVHPPAEQMEKFLDLFQPRSLRQGWYFLRAGDPSTQLAFVNTGLLRYFYQSEDGKEYNKSFSRENQFAVAYSAFLNETPARFSIQALEETELLVAPLGRVAGLFHEHCCWEALGRILAEQLFIKKELREAELLLDDIETRYQRFIEEHPDLNQRLTKYHIASYIGTTPDVLSEILRR